jgi:hypothetical protein
MHKWVLGVLLLAVLVACPTETYYTVTATAGAGGKVSPTSQKVLKGTSTVITFTPNSGFLIQGISGTCPGVNVAGRFATGNIKEDCTVNGTFKVAPPPSFTVTATAGIGGTISPATQEVSVGGTAVVTVTPDAGYVVDQASGCGGSINPNGTSYTTGIINASCGVSITFKVNAPPKFTVTATAGIGGSVSPPTQEVTVGGSTTITVTANTGYKVDQATGCGGSINADGTSYTTGVINANCGVSITFKVGTPTLGANFFTVTGLGVLYPRDYSYRISALPAPVGGRPLVIWLKDTNTSLTDNPYGLWTDQQAAILVSPNNVDGFWRNRMDGKNSDGTAGYDDVAFVEELIVRATNTSTPLFGTGNTVDPNQVFVLGESTHGEMVYTLYADPRTKNRINAIAPLFSYALSCQTSNIGNGTLPYIPPSDSDFNCGEHNGAGYFFPKLSLYSRTNPPRILGIYGNSTQFPVPTLPDLDNPDGQIIQFVKQWAINSNNCGSSLPSANPVFTALIGSPNDKVYTVKAYRQRNTTNTAPCAADVTFFIVENGGPTPQGYGERVIKWFFGKYNTLNNTFTP